MCSSSGTIVEFGEDRRLGERVSGNINHESHESYESEIMGSDQRTIRSYRSLPWAPKFTRRPRRYPVAFK